MTSIQTHIQSMRAQLPPSVRLVAVSKFHPAEAVQEAYEAGQRLFGESHAQELVPKARMLPSDIEWHFIGHLQTNKVKQIIPYVACIQSVDSGRLLCEIDKQAARAGRVVDVLLQFHIAREETKSGFTREECLELLASPAFRQMTSVRVTGVMGMATATDDMEQVRREFHTLKALFEELRQTVFAGRAEFCEISMGMSHDWPVAVEEGATLIRVGTAIFGQRDYGK
ncbi:MAG: YggS family pyridoxal phosphate-dependent enzyme [Paludibacteraceae bacterium]|nr:YggS family pyridoxal phosphate-dependent enzyme [Paludibacteraceae bacterium]